MERSFASLKHNVGQIAFQITNVDRNVKILFFNLECLVVKLCVGVSWDQCFEIISSVFKRALLLIKLSEELSVSLMDLLTDLLQAEQSVCDVVVSWPL